MLEKRESIRPGARLSAASGYFRKMFGETIEHIIGTTGPLR